MKNNEALTLLSDALDLQRETLTILREALAVLKEAVEELKASRKPAYAPITITPSPYTNPLTPYTYPNTEPRWIGDPPPHMTPTITCEGKSNSIANAHTCEANGTSVFFSNTGAICGKQ